MKTLKLKIAVIELVSLGIIALIATISTSYLFV